MSNENAWIEPFLTLEMSGSRYESLGAASWVDLLPSQIRTPLLETEKDYGYDALRDESYSSTPLPVMKDLQYCYFLSQL